MKHDAYFLEMRGISKYFSQLIANDAIDLAVKHGEVLGILGENGAGKTTLMNILYGLCEPDRGEIVINGRPIKIHSPKQAIAHGIGMVHQHFMLIPTHTVVENLVLGLASQKGRLKLQQAAADILDLSKQLGFQINPWAYVKDLPVGVQQKVEILKSIYRDAKLLIMDEPTAVLTPQESAEMFKILRHFVQSGNSVIFISHKLHEVMAITDRITVLRDGKLIGTVHRRETDANKLARMMVGREISFTVQKSTTPPARQTGLRVENVSVSHRHEKALLKDLSFSIQCGEILGIAGVSGNGQEELANVLSGLLKADSGQIYVGATEISRLSARDIHECGVGFIPSDRQKTGLILEMSVRENLLLKNFYHPPYASGYFINHEATLKNAQSLIEDYTIKVPSPDSKVKNLSGGHQQKVVVARELSLDPQLLIAFQPTRGLDIGAIEYVHRVIMAYRDKGKSVLLISTELSEVFGLSDRIGVLYQGQILKIFDAEEATIEEIGLLMAGVRD
ncbi:heme ABC transporter ATP-binding protein [candidate division KSB3 bacterium]|uniref:Heme ABC transporter ATP-binding protein n=1 Tax=candidate division KSB3 bacterium TaxID=2044937 RepID=A0A2G6E5T2_9BACT|nr:MAG: heme ABC transporter ATP-binding protein [candidate division KSB3 bacterium]PIE29961.1 MAG: heme ABC transporter ATP-binding protein [candidate division KSB3 bacterium]